MSVRRGISLCVNKSILSVRYISSVLFGFGVVGMFLLKGGRLVLWGRVGLILLYVAWITRQRYISLSVGYFLFFFSFVIGGMTIWAGKEDLFWYDIIGIGVIGEIKGVVLGALLYYLVCMVLFVQWNKQWMLPLSEKSIIQREE